MINVVTPDEISRRGEIIYKEYFKDKYEGKHNGKYLAINVETKKAYLAEYSEDALIKAQNENSDSLLYLVRIGEETAFRVGYTGIRNYEFERSFQQSA